MRKATPETIIQLVDAAFQEDPDYTLVCLFYLRDVIHGQGERRFFRIALNHLSHRYPQIIATILALIPEYGRWDDLFSLKATELYSSALHLIVSQLKKDTLACLTQGDKASISLAAKWVGSENSGPLSRERADDLRNALGLDDCDGGKAAYRRIVSRLRTYLRIVEQKLCAQQWSEINYSHVPSLASLKYRKAFQKHDGERYQAYLDELKKPESERQAGTKMNTKALTPYDIVSKILYNHGEEENATLEAAWANLPDYLGGKEHSTLVVCDTSGSMMGQPITVAVALAMYIAERNKGLWANTFISFSESPSLQKLKGNTVTERVRNLYDTDWGYNTNLQAVFDLILNAARKHELSAEEMPATVIIISDMQFDAACRGDNVTNLQNIRQKFSNAGYTCPNLVFWNVNATLKQESPARYNSSGVTLVSGMSPSIFQGVISGDLDPVKAMLKILDADRYNPVREALKSANLPSNA